MIQEAFFVTQVQGMQDMLYRISVSLLRRDQDAQDAVQQALMKAWAAKWKAEEDYFRPWLTRIVINECHTLLRKRKREQSLPQGQGYSPPPDIDLRDALERLPEKLRVPLLLHSLEGFTMEEIASIQKVPVSTVKGRLYRGRKALHDQLYEKEACAYEA